MKYNNLKREDLGNLLKTNFNIVFTNLIKEKCGNDVNSNNSKITVSDIASDLGITYQALVNYKKNRMPEYKQLAVIKDYFDVSYSYLLGETKEKKLDGDNFQIDLSGSAIDRLKEISKNAKNGDYTSGALTYILESLLLDKDNEILKTMAYLLILKAISNKEEQVEDLTDYTSFILVKRILNHLDILSKELTLPNEILYSVYDKLKKEVAN